MKPTQKSDKLPLAETSKVGGSSIPNLLTVTNLESLSTTICIKVWPSVASWLENNGKADFIRQSIIEKMQRIQDKPKPVKCSGCKHLTKADGKPYCQKQFAFFPGDEKFLNFPWFCEDFEEAKK